MYYCHGPKLSYVRQQQDRVRGYERKLKYLRTRKSNNNGVNGYPCGFYTIGFAVQGCYNDFANKYVEQIIRIAPRHEPLETPITRP